MLNYLWAFMIIMGVLWGAFHGTMNKVTQGALESAKEAVSLCITMLGVMSLWTGILNIGQRSGLIERLSNAMAPLMRFLFPGLPKEHPACEAMSTNMIANVLGLGWAATPAGLKAMEELAKLEEERREQNETDAQKLRQLRDDSEREQSVRSIQRGLADRAAWNSRKRQRPGTLKAMPHGVASNEMCTFLILNISSLQLIPVNIIAYRSQYGSVNPTAIVGPGIVATAVSTGVAIVFCKMMDKRKRKA